MTQLKNVDRETEKEIVDTIISDLGLLSMINCPETRSMGMDSFNKLYNGSKDRFPILIYFAGLVYFYHPNFDLLTEQNTNKEDWVICLGQLVEKDVYRHFNHLFLIFSPNTLDRLGSNIFNNKEYLVPYFEKAINLFITFFQNFDIYDTNKK